jgi:hypothetical protein
MVSVGNVVPPPLNWILVKVISVISNDVIGVVAENEVSYVSRLPVLKCFPELTASLSFGVNSSVRRVTLRSGLLNEYDVIGI